MPPPQSISQALSSLEQAFTLQNPKSQALYQNATQSLPGGNTRTVLFYSPFPLYITSASGAHLHSADGDTYLDLLGEYTAGLYGHSDPTIMSAINQALQKGVSFGGHHSDEARLASLIQQRFPTMELLRFTNSGTEANLMALAAAKVYTGRKKILVFGEAYHGGVFLFGGGVSGKINAPHEYLIATYNDIASVKRLVDANAQDLAAIILEPMIGSGGAIPADRQFLVQLRKIATAAGAVLIYDEVMSSRMYSGGGVQSDMPPDCRPDLTTLGKYIGGGMSFGAFGGKREIMELFDPRKPGGLAHAGTFNNNVLTMAAGSAGLEQVFTPARAEALHRTGEELRKRLNETGKGTLLKVTGLGSVMCFHFTQTPAEQVKTVADMPDEDLRLTALLHLFLLNKGYYIARRGFLALSLVLTDAGLDGFVQAVKDFVEEYKPLLESKSNSIASKL